MAYSNSSIDWAALRALAARVARETRVARLSHTVSRQITKTREVRGGFLGLSKQTEEYTVPVTKTVTDDYWILEKRYWKRYEKGSGSMADETTYEWTYYCLSTDGSLIVRHEGWEEVQPKTMPYFEHRHDPQITSMTEQDVLLLDFEPEYYRDKGSVSIESTRNPDKRKPRGDTKGIGLTRALHGFL
jgi:hypothetical protein